MNILQLIWADLRYGCRSFRKDLAFTLAAVLTLGLGIGATTAIYSILRGILLDPFPYQHADRLSVIYVHDLAQPRSDGRSVFSIPEFSRLREQSHTFEDIAGARGLDILYTTPESTLQIQGAWVTSNMFAFLGTQPLQGRRITESDIKSDSPPVFVMSYRLWSAQFNRDPQLLGRAFTLNGEQYTLVGIMPPRFLFANADIWFPLDPKNPATQKLTLWTLGRLKPGATISAASVDLEAIIRGLAAEFPDAYPKRFSVLTRILLDEVVGPFKSMLAILTAGVGMLFLIACSNVSNLLLARATAREKEIAIRASLGASRRRLLGQLVVEGSLLAGTGCMVGLLIAERGLKAIVAAIPLDTIPPEASLAISWPAIFFAIGVAFLATLFCCIVPAIRGGRGELCGKLRDAGKGLNTVVQHGRIRDLFVVLQIGLSVVLFVLSGLMMRSLVMLRHVELGFNPERVLFVRVPLPKDRYTTLGQKKEFFDRALENISHLPDVVSAAETTSIPPYGGRESAVVVAGGVPVDHPPAVLEFCSDQYFATLGLRLARGRLLSPIDVASAHRVVVINQTLAREFFGSADPLSRHLAFKNLDQTPDSSSDVFFEIIGVVEDVKNQGVEKSIAAEAFMPYTVSSFGGRALLVKTKVDPISILATVRKQIWAVDSNVALTSIGTLQNYLDEYSYAQPHFGLVVLGLFALIGIALVSLGVFGSMSYIVSLRTYEIGIRMALGAQKRHVLWTMLWEGLRLVAVGVIIGGIISIFSARLVANQIWGVPAYDPIALGVAVLTVISVGVFSTLFPAVKATRVDPLTTMHNE
jgi:putative ABC transport system permease protein